MTPAIRALYRRHDAEHARRDTECHTCHDSRTFWCFIAPDPAGMAQARVDRMAIDWQHAHPCTAQFAHPRRIQRAA